MNIERVQRISMSDQVCDQLKKLMFDGVLKPGDKIGSENELCNSFGVSRVTIREALMKLTAMGLLESRYGSGTYVREVEVGTMMNAIIPIAYLGMESVLEVLEFRQVIEVRTAGLATKLATEEDIKRLEEIYEVMKQNVNREKEFSEADLKFHIELSKITKNTLIIETMMIIKDILSENIYSTVQLKGHEGGIKYHKMLIDAIREHNPEKTMAIMEEHLQDAYNTFEERLEVFKKEQSK